MAHSYIYIYIILRIEREGGQDGEEGDTSLRVCGPVANTVGKSYDVLVLCC